MNNTSKLSKETLTFRYATTDQLLSIRVPVGVRTKGYDAFTKKEAQEIAAKNRCCKKDVVKVKTSWEYLFLIVNQEGRVLLTNGKYADIHD